MNKPTLGFPSRTAAVMALLSQGKVPPAIAAMIGIPVSTVAALRCSAERAKPYRASPDRSRTVHVPLGLLQKLAPHARRRGISREGMAWLIVETVVEAGLVDAVLDDQEELASA